MLCNWLKAHELASLCEQALNSEDGLAYCHIWHMIMWQASLPVGSPPLP